MTKTNTQVNLQLQRRGATWAGTWLSASAAALLTMAAAPSQAAPLGTGTSTLSGIRYELIDLRPDDGQTPWIRFAQPLTGRLDATGQSHLDMSRQASWEGLLPGSATSITSSDGYSSASAGPGTLSTSFQVDTALLDATSADNRRVEVFSQATTGNGIPSLSYSVDEETGKVTAVDGQTGWQPFDFTLSPHTAIVVHAQASAQVTLDAGAAPWDVRRPGGPVEEEPMIASGVQAALMLTRSDFQMKAEYASLDDFYADMDQAYALTFDGVSADWTPDDLATMTPASRDLLLSLDNASDLEAQGSLTFTGMSQFAVWRPTAVPEPATWTLMALGLVAAAARARALRQRQRI